MKEAEKMFWGNTVKQQNLDRPLGDLDLNNQTHIRLIEQAAQRLVEEHQKCDNHRSTEGNHNVPEHHRM